MNQEVNGIFVAAHELKAPLSILRQLALSVDLENDSKKDLEQIRSAMVDVSERAIRQVNDLTKVARLEDGLFTMEPVSVRSVCDDVTRELNQLFARNECRIVTKYSNKSKLVVANRDLLFSVVYNFLINAVHYSESGSKSQLRVCDHKNTVKISVRDFGPALPMDIWRQVKSGRLAQPTAIAMRPGSSGLGLYIASKFSHYMNANVGAIRHRDGTSFFVELPISNQARLF